MVLLVHRKNKIHAIDHQKLPICGKLLQFLID